MRRRQRGFTLLELALVLLVITVLLGGLAVPFTRQIETRRIAETQKAMATIQDALVGYAMGHSYQCTYDNTGSNPVGPSYCPATGPANQTVTYHYLPCPASQYSNGQEDRNTTTGQCVFPAPGQPVGLLPWATLGLPEADAWGNTYSYDVVGDYANNQKGFDSASLLLPPSPPGQVYLCASSICPTPQVPAVPIAAVVISHGPNGLGAYSASNNAWNAAPSSADETANAIYRSLKYVSHPPVDAGSPGGPFDDLVVGLSLPALLNRVCPAGGC